MKKVLFTIALVVIFVLTSYAQSDGFFRNNDNLTYREYDENIDSPLFPGAHGYTNNIEAPLGSGLLILTALGTAYALKKKRS